jgi:NitT/TauT family transport system permease protein
VRSRQHAYIWLVILSPLLLLLGWEWAASNHWIQVAWYPAPSLLWKNFLMLAKNGELWKHTAATLKRLWWVFAISTGPGMAVGLLMGISPAVRAAIDPVITLVYPIPAVLFLPVFALLFGPGELSVIVTSSITSFVIVAVNTMAAVRGLDRHLLEAGRNFGATGWRLFAKVLLPGALPAAFTGVRVGLGMAVILLIATEMKGAQVGLGQFLWFSWGLLDVPATYVALLTVGVVGLAVTYGLEWAGRLLMPWQEDLLARKRGA